jgi:uncharacterized protein
MYGRIEIYDRGAMRFSVCVHLHEHWRRTMTEEKRKQGFALLSPEKRCAIASLGGKAAHELGKAHKWASDSARIASNKGWSKAKGKSNE